MLRAHSDVKAALDKWLLHTETWHTSHSLDMQRWDKFFNEYQKHHSNAINEESLYQLIKERLDELGQYCEKDYLKKLIKFRIS